MCSAVALEVSGYSGEYIVFYKRRCRLGCEESGCEVGVFCCLLYFGFTI